MQEHKQHGNNSLGKQRKQATTSRHPTSEEQPPKSLKKAFRTADTSQTDNGKGKQATQARTSHKGQATAFRNPESRPHKPPWASEPPTHPPSETSHPERTRKAHTDSKPHQRQASQRNESKHLQTLNTVKTVYRWRKNRTAKKLHNTIIFYVTPVFIKTHQTRKDRQTEERNRKNWNGKEKSF